MQNRSVLFKDNFIVKGLSRDIFIVKGLLLQTPSIKYVCLIYFLHKWAFMKAIHANVTL